LPTIKEFTLEEKSLNALLGILASGIFIVPETAKSVKDNFGVLLILEVIFASKPTILLAGIFVFLLIRSFTLPEKSFKTLLGRLALGKDTGPVLTVSPVLATIGPFAVKSFVVVEARVVACEKVAGPLNVDNFVNVFAPVKVFADPSRAGAGATATTGAGATATTGAGATAGAENFGSSEHQNSEVATFGLETDSSKLAF